MHDGSFGIHACIADSGAIRCVLICGSHLRCSVNRSSSPMFFSDEIGRFDSHSFGVRRRLRIVARRAARGHTQLGERERVQRRTQQGSVDTRHERIDSSRLVGLGKRSGREDISCWNAAGLPDRLPEGRYHVATALNPTQLPRNLLSVGPTVTTASSAIASPRRRERFNFACRPASQSTKSSDCALPPRLLAI